jgi:hypothetical protein
LLHLALLPTKFIASAILDLFTGRIHSRIVEKGTREKGRGWVRLWYLCRFLDRRGSGYVRLPVVVIEQLLGASSSTIYQWLREGKIDKAFRWWKVQRGNLRVALGSLFAVSHALGLQRDLNEQEVSSRKKFNLAKGLPKNTAVKNGLAPWGVTAKVGLHQILVLRDLRAAATASVTQRLQQLSRFAAWRALPEPIRHPIDPETGEKQTFHLPQPDDFFQRMQQGQFSDDSASGNLPRCCIHIGKRRAWVSRGFIPFGTSQTAIARERGICDRTIRRHLALFEVESRQIVQSKAEYRAAAECIARDAGGVEPSKDVLLRSSEDGSYYLNEQGLGGRYSHKVGEVGFNGIHSRFFRYGKKPTVWLYRCNIYNPAVKLCTMSAARSTYRKSPVRRGISLGYLAPLLDSNARTDSTDVTDVEIINGQVTLDVTDVEIINGQVTLLLYDPHTTTSARREETTLCNSVDNSLEIFPGGNAIPAEKDGHFS